MSTLVFVLLALAVVAALVILVAPHADPSPDGLEQVAAEHDIDAGADQAENRFVDTWVPGLVGVAVTFAVGAGSVYAVRRARHRAAPSSA